MAFKTASRKDEAARERALNESRRLSLYIPNGEEMYFALEGFWRAWHATNTNRPVPERGASR